MHIHNQGMVNNHTVHTLYRIMVTVNNVIGGMKMGNIFTRIEPIYLTFWANLLTIILHKLPDVPTVPMPTAYELLKK